MKRLTAALLVLLLLFSGCAGEQAQDEHTVTFYYLEKDYPYDGQGTVIVPEERQTDGSRRDLTYLLALYLMGPTEEEHVMPLPSGTRIYGSLQDNGNLLLQLSDRAKNLSDSEFTLACACLTMTCLEFTDAKTVTVQLGDRSTTMGADSLTLLDTSGVYPAAEETQ